MEEAARLRERIASLRELRSVIRAMRGIAASRIQEAQAALAGIRNYTAIVEGAIRHAATLAPRLEAPAGGPEAERPDLLIVAAAELGFVGGYNDAVLERAAGLLGPGQRLGIIGRRGAAVAEERGLPLAWHVAGTTTVHGVSAVARRVTERVAETSRARIVFARYRGSEGYALDARRVLPLDPRLLAGAGQRVPPVHHLTPQRLLETLAEEYLFAGLMRALMEGLASENGARLATMQAADHNIGDKLDTLERQERVVRQQAITVELLDVVTGAEAMASRR